MAGWWTALPDTWMESRYRPGAGGGLSAGGQPFDHAANACSTISNVPQLSEKAGDPANVRGHRSSGRPKRVCLATHVRVVRLRSLRGNTSGRLSRASRPEAGAAALHAQPGWRLPSHAPITLRRDRGSPSL